MNDQGRCESHEEEACGHGGGGGGGLGLCFLFLHFFFVETINRKVLSVGLEGEE